MEAYRHVQGFLSAEELSRRHRGVTLSDQGERTLIAYTFDSPDKKPNPLRDWITRRLNY